MHCSRDQHKVHRNIDVRYENGGDKLYQRRKASGRRTSDSIVDARYEKVREGGVVRDAAVLSAIGIGPDERRRVLGVSCALSEAEVHWRAFLESLISRGMRGVHSWSPTTTRACARRARRCSPAPPGNAAFHLAQNAIHHGAKF